MFFLDCGRKLEPPEKTHPSTGGTYKLHTERLLLGFEPGTFFLWGNRTKYQTNHSQLYNRTTLWSIRVVSLFISIEKLFVMWQYYNNNLRETIKLDGTKVITEWLKLVCSYFSFSFYGSHHHVMWSIKALASLEKKMPQWSLNATCHNLKSLFLPYITVLRCD